jgi:hypothetical protein
MEAACRGKLTRKDDSWPAWRGACQEAAACHGVYLTLLSRIIMYSRYGYPVPTCQIRYICYTTLHNPISDCTPAKRYGRPPCYRYPPRLQSGVTALHNMDMDLDQVPHPSHFSALICFTIDVKIIIFFMRDKPHFQKAWTEGSFKRYRTLGNFLVIFSQIFSHWSPEIWQD